MNQYGDPKEALFWKMENMSRDLADDFGDLSMKQKKNTRKTTHF